MPWRVWNWSTERKLPLLFTGLLAIVIAGFTGAAYRQVRHASVAGATERLQRVTNQLVELLSASVRQLVSNAQQVAERPAVRSYLRAPLSGVRGELLGYVVRLRRISGSAQGGRQLAQLIGSDAALYFGNASGDVWTDFSAPVPGPPVDVRDARGLIEYRREGGAAYLAAPARVPATPWMVMGEFPRAPGLAPARAFL